jgi:hypothetical protein
MLKLFIASAVLLASATYAWAPPQRSSNYYNNNNFTVNSNGTVKRTPKYATSASPTPAPPRKHPR